VGLKMVSTPNLRRYSFNTELIAPARPPEQFKKSLNISGICNLIM
jgi:hypothetical protein